MSSEFLLIKTGSALDSLTARGVGFETMFQQCDGRGGGPHSGMSGVCYGYWLLVPACRGALDFHPRGREIGPATFELTDDCLHALPR